MRLVETRMRGEDGRFPTFSFLSFPLIFFFFFCQHGAVDPDDIPFMPILDFNSFFFFLVLQSLSLLSCKADGEVKSHFVLLWLRN